MKTPEDMNIKSEPVPEYNRSRSDSTASITPPENEPEPQRQDDAIIQRALCILAGRLRAPGQALKSPAAVKKFLTLKLAERERETFAALFLDNRHRVIACEELFYGTIDGASVHPREVVKAALACNAAACILCHNHPSQVTRPSQADYDVTKRLRDALALVDIRTLDHIIIGGTDALSFAENGLL